ncbi:MAG: hypothetical protein MK098_00190 [Marinovum sp.]|nr:hypothetical protein [Marinovum sp.]
MSDLTPLSYSSVQRVQALHQTTALWRLLREPEVQVFDVRLDDDVKKLPRLAPRAQRLSPKEAAEQAGPALVFCHTGLKLSTQA